MKKNLLTLAVLGASVALLAGCGATTPEVPEQNGAVVEEVAAPTPTVETAPTTTETTTTETTPTTTTTTAPATTTTTPAAATPTKAE
ncbi:MAG: hypothetical protein WCJ39_07055 [bacterium]